MRFGVLGPLTVWTDAGEVVSIPGAKVRALLADLLAHEGRVVSADRLVADLWGDDVPGNPVAALQVRVSQLRRALEEAEPGGKLLVVSRAPGYQLRVEPDAVDAARFARLVAEKRLPEALDLWRGSAYADFADHEFAQHAITRLEEARLAAVEELSEVRLAAGEPVDVTELTNAHPLRERLRAVHMQALYRAGRQSEALAAYAELRERLAGELGLDPSPELADLHTRILRQDPALSGPARRRQTNLPAPVNDLIGRETAVAEIRALLGTARLVTLTGSGGVGKTRLALETAAGLAADHADGVWLVELAAHEKDDTGSLAEAVLAALDVRDGAGPDSALERLVDALRARRLLLVLDNCEHVVEHAARLADELLRAAPGLRVLATSREPLCVAGEALYAVPPLDLPKGGDLRAVAGSHAVRLFLARAAASARGFALDETNAAAVAQLCRRLDGLPLALELAATRVRALGVEELVARLDDRFRVLSGWQRGGPARQQTLSATIDWSWTLLSDAERVVLRRLSIHSDGCTLQAAEEVCGGDGLDVLELIARLVDRSLVTVVDGPAGTRYRLLESVAAYCRRRLDDAGETERVRRAHVECYAALAVRAEARLRGPEQAQWLRRLDAEAANLRAALDAAPADAALRLVNALAWYWFLRGRLREARRALDVALRAPGDAPEADRARARAWRAGFALLLGQDAGWADWKDTLAMDDPGDRARAEWFFAWSMPDLPSARALADSALLTFREQGDRWGVAVTLSVLARDAYTRRDFPDLERTGTESERLFRELGDRWGLLQATEWLGGLAEVRGEYERASRMFTEGLHIAEELGLWPEAAGRLSWLGWIALSLGEYDRAMETCERALRLSLGQGHRQGEIFARMGLGYAARKAGRPDLAEEHLNAMLAGVPRDPDLEPALHLPTVLVELGFVRHGRGEAEAARELFLEAFAAARKIGDPLSTAWAVEALAATVPAGEAARLLGLAAAARAAAGVRVNRHERDDIDRITEQAQRALGAEPFAAAHALGGGQGFDDVL
ncbi:AfsR/SARP family transcriptional regulator [Spongiactinospora rosea]|uniref:AfsR/SARP family transcriptional regulator n=1 Tax=Spongiactinospora rosea TaxID=2248750 RepID=A0A366LLG8_9ACTN|nr:BTAD domain-containing putative transcriptional regulator [Spongiactinospora rosea]RBQ14343.1 AfsR/SARP family transcriptional regulator [Spongiactinospora rosea]